MKNVYFIFLLFVSTGLQLNSQNVLTEDFIFDPVDSLENSGQWHRSGINTEFNVKVITPGLEYIDYVGSGRGNCSLISNDGNGDIVFRNFSSAITTGSAYMSFMFRIDSLPASFSQGYCISYNPNTGGTNLNTSLQIKRLTDTSFDLGIQKVGGFAPLFSNSSFDIHKTYLVVLKYSILPGTGDDSANLYVFETGVPTVEPNIPLVSNNMGDDLTGQGSVYLNNNYAQNGLRGCLIKIDGIRVGTSWETSVLAVLTSAGNEKSKDELRNENFPNPFQSRTKISFQLPAKGRVKIEIFNASGIKCAELLNKMEESGNHEVEWDATNMPAGDYSCLIQLNGKTVNHKLLLIK